MKTILWNTHATCVGILSMLWKHSCITGRVGIKKNKLDFLVFKLIRRFSLIGGFFRERCLFYKCYILLVTVTLPN